MNYSFLSLFNSPPLVYPRGPIYIPSIGSEGSIRSVSRHMEGQESTYLLLDEGKTPNIYFLAYFLMCVGHSGEYGMYMRVING